jgi:hypothetical protein
MMPRRLKSLKRLSKDAWKEEVLVHLTDSNFVAERISVSRLELFGSFAAMTLVTAPAIT